jgi:cytochrome c biogenesis protein CcmG, thiol:disulfide interchange protein DsbE
MSDIQPETSPKARPGLRLLLALLPFLAFVGLSAIFAMQLLSGRDTSQIPSALIGHKAPDLAMPPLEGSQRPALTHAFIAGKLTLVNVFASWCIPCRQEHPYLLQLAKDPRITLVAINYKDKNDNALRFLGELGNPFAAIGIDQNGASAIDWGVYGVPESYLVDQNGVIVYKKIGPFDARSIEGDLNTAIEKALKPS